MKIKKIISYMQEKDINPLKVDAWEDSRAEIYSALKRKYDEGKRDFKKDGHRILIEYTPSGGELTSPLVSLRTHWLFKPN